MDIAYYIQQYLVILALILVGYYLLPAGTAYWLFYIFRKEQWKRLHIQQRYPSRRTILREIKWSLLSVAILSFFTLLLYRWVQLGYTKMYFSVSRHGWVYLVVSSVLIILAYDTYYYWLHRFMHLKKVFPWLHKTHHLSHTPSPWATLAFNPPETILEFAIYPILLFLIPLHPIAIAVFVVYNIILNTSGHIGFEIVPRSFLRHPLMKFGLTVTHHDMHHSKINCNYGIYFSFWDRIMGTNHKDYEKTFEQVHDQTGKI